LAFRVEAHPVIAALDLLAGHAAERERCEAVWTAVGERRCFAGLRAEQHDLVAADRARERRMTDLPRKRDHLPAIAKPHGVVSPANTHTV
jgi:hypothetical protein